MMGNLFANVGKKAGHAVKVTLLSGAVVMAPYAKAGCEDVLGHQEVRCGDVEAALQELPKIFFTSTATNTPL